MKRILRLRVVDRLKERFTLEALPGTPGLVMGDAVVPITNVDSLLKTAKRVTGATASLGIAHNALADILTVPDGKRYTLLFYYIYRDSGDNTFESVTLADSVGGVLYEAFSTAPTHSKECGNPITLEEKHKIQIYTSGAGSGASVFKISAWVEEEDAY